jgi:hypothetical protein
MLAPVWQQLTSRENIVILSDAKNLVCTTDSHEILRFAQNDRHPVNGYPVCVLRAKSSSAAQIDGSPLSPSILVC